MLRGELTYLVPLDAANAETVRAWINDPEIHRWMMSGHVPVSAAAEVAWYEHSEELQRAGEAYRFEVHDASDGALIGTCGLEHVSALHRHGEIGLLIAPPDRWGRGFGADVLRTLLRFAFDTLGMHTARITVFAGNERAFELYKRVGFTETGRDREAYFLGGAFRDLVRLDMTEDEWRALYPA